MRAHRWAWAFVAALTVVFTVVPAASATVQLAEPRNLHVASNTAEAVTLAWDDVPEVGGGGIYYEVYFDDQTYPIWAPTAEVKIPRNDIVGLEPGTAHTFRVRAGDPSGNLSEFSEIGATWADGDVTPPTAPTDLRVVSRTEAGVNLAWDPSTDDSGELFYTISFSTGVNLELGNEPRVFVSSNDAFIGTTPGATVQVQVRADDFTRWNPSASSNTISVTF
jgi:hypothetical protein